jgi:flagellar basal body-associated protein FliL
MIWIIISIVIYLLSAVGYWFYVHNEYHATGVEELWTMVTPIVNTVAIIDSLTGSYNWNKFFKIK